MDIEVVERAVAQLVSQGIRLAAISGPMVREILGAGSYRDITKHLRALKEAAGVLVDEEPSEAPEPDTAEELPPLEDPVRAAEAALAEAQQALQAKAELRRSSRSG